MNLFFLADVLSVVMFFLIMVFFSASKNYEDKKFTPSFNALLFGMFFIVVYLVFGIVAFLASSSSNKMLVYSADILVLPIASIFFLVAAFLHK